MPIPSLDFGFTKDSCRRQDRNSVIYHIRRQNQLNRMVCVLLHFFQISH